MSIQEDDWELDINLGSDSTHNIFQRKGVYSFEPDKELVLACERYQYPTQSTYFDDDDTNSSIASSSIVSSRYSELDTALNNLDDFMYDDPPAVEIPQINRQDLPGVVKRVGLPARYRQVLNNDDWNDDIEMPNNGVSLNPTKRTFDNDQHITLFDDDVHSDDDIGPSVSQRGSCSRQSLFSYEPEEDEDDMTGIDFPDNMALLPKRLDEKKKQVPEPTTIVKPTRIPTAASTHKSKILATIPRESDDDDFLDGLNIKEDKAFTISTPASKLPMQQQRSTPLPKGKTTATNFVSRLARPTPLNQYKKTAADQLIHITSTSASKKTSTPRRFLAGTQASFHREAETTAKRSTCSTTVKRTQRTKNTPSLSKTIDLPSEKKSANGYTLIARPKTKVATGYYCSRLDNIDNLVDFRPRRIHRHPKCENKVDPVRPWCKNMQTNAGPSKSKVKLIQPNEQNLKKEYNTMKYDDTTHSWKGNETSLTDFQEKPARRSRLMLMTNKQQKPSKYAAVVGNNMIFNAESQKWVSAFGAQQECNELDEIEDLKEELYQIPSKRNHNKKVEFKLSVETKRQMMFDQEKHESWVKHWPLKAKEPEISSRSGHSVGASKYFLFRQNY